MKGDLCFQDKERIEREILRYLLDNPNSQATIVGIMQWWLLERKIKYQTELVKEAPEDLIVKHYVNIEERYNSINLYKINHNKAIEIKEILEKNRTYK